MIRWYLSFVTGVYRAATIHGKYIAERILLLPFLLILALPLIDEHFLFGQHHIHNMISVDAGYWINLKPWVSHSTKAIVFIRKPLTFRTFSTFEHIWI